MKTRTLLIKASVERLPSWSNVILVGFALGCFALPPRLQAVVPPPDGGYPGFNTAEGQNALFNLTTGTFNTAVGSFSLFNDIDGYFNTAVGAGSLLSNTGSQNTGGGIFNTGIGATALLSNTTGRNNTANGAGALSSNVTGSANTANGAFALQSNSTGFKNTAAGSSALHSNIEGHENTCIGNEALELNVDGNNNTAIGSFALNRNDRGDNNTASGFNALSSNVDGSNNIAVGARAGVNLTGNSNIDIGNEGVTGESSTIRIGTASVHTRTFVAGINSAMVSGGAVFVNGAGQLGIQISSGRFKDHIEPLDKASEAILALRPVTFHYKDEIDPDRTPQFGLVAEEVEKVNSDLIVRGKDGRPYTVRYDAVNVMLLNEFLKAHRQFTEQQASLMDLRSTVARQEKQLKAAIAQIKEQAAQIQKVSARTDLQTPTPQQLALKIQ